METAIKTFSSDPSIFLGQIKELDVAGIAGTRSNPDLDMWHWGVDMVRTLREWDISGDLSAVAYPILEAAGRARTQDDLGAYHMQYAGILCAEDESNTKWLDEYEASTDWITIPGVKPYKFRTYSADHTYWAYFGTNGRPTFMIIPLYAESFQAYLIVEIVKA